MSALTHVHELVGPYAAVAHAPRRVHTPYNPDWYHVYLSHSARQWHDRPFQNEIAGLAGSGRSADPETAGRVSVIETLERLATCTPQDEFVLGDADSLPDAIDLDTVPRCSRRELDHPQCSLIRPSPSEPIRWTKGIDLRAGRPVLLPSVMVYLGLKPFPAERFWQPISTGAAAGPTWESALINAVCEVIERDMISVIWLQRMALPRLDPAHLTDESLRLIDWCARKFITVHLFDATSEIGVPTVYCVQEAPHDPVVGRVVSASTTRDLGAAAASAITESLSIRPSLQAASRQPQLIDMHVRGALEIGRAERNSALDFLLHPSAAAGSPQPTLDNLSGPDERQNLRNLLRACERAGHDVYAVDLTTPEAAEIGLHVARVVMPSLQPVTFARHARFLDHPRLYRLPALLGNRVLAEKDLNPDPQPFA
ncbi:YcaO-like family protein [Streptomyces sp. NPDC058092]|uniref:YcaO-like family protein n=1 Tax=Streptomyces sp. NPDC058092 TaxID=3346336 RepID=UPI0036F05510